MQKSYSFILLLLLSLFLVFTFTNAMDIDDCADLEGIGSTGTYTLMFDLTCSNFNPIATFSGTFEGNYKKITITSFGPLSGDNQGLFREFGSGADVRNLLLDLSIDGTIGSNVIEKVGGLVGFIGGQTTLHNVFLDSGSIIGEEIVGGLIGGMNTNEPVRITNCGTNAGVSVTSNARYVGGLIGYQEHDTSDVEIRFCTSESSVTGESHAAGGFVGRFDSGLIEQCYATGNVVSSAGNNHGGFFGYCDGGTYRDCYALGNVDGVNRVGGFGGYPQVNTPTIDRCYSAGDITGNSQVSAFIGSGSATVTDSFFDDGVIPQTGTYAMSADLDSTAGHSTLQGDGWSTSVWSFVDGQFPELKNAQHDFDAGTTSDPHFAPISKNKTINKMTYLVEVKQDKSVYNIVSHPSLQWNGRWKIYNDIPLALPSFQFNDQFGLILKSPSRIYDDCKIVLRIKTDKEKKRYVRVELEVNGKKVEFNNKKKILPFGQEFPEFSINFLNSWSVFIKCPLVELKVYASFINLLFRHDWTVSQRAKLRKVPHYKWSYLNTKAKFSDEIKFAHGLLGQTARSDCPYKPPHKNCFSCFVNGTVEDYRIQGDHLLGSNFKYNQFK